MDQSIAATAEPRAPPRKFPVTNAVLSLLRASRDTANTRVWLRIICACMATSSTMIATSGDGTTVVSRGSSRMIASAAATTT